MNRIHPNKHILIHIPKNAGTSIRQNADGRLVHAIQKQNVTKTVTPDHLDFMVHHCPATYLHRQLKSHPKVAVIRNPWSRLVSLYEHADHLREHGVGDYFQREKISWDEFIDRIDSYIQTSVFYYNHPYDHFASQSDWLTPEVKLLRYEHLSEDYEKLFKTPLTTIANKGVYKEHYTCYYSKNQIEKVREWFRYDIYKFGWDFETTARNIR